jgi:hypothetical protein
MKAKLDEKAEDKRQQLKDELIDDDEGADQH